MELKIEYEKKLQRDTIEALCQCFEPEGLNIDKFMFWIIENYKDNGSSIFLKWLNDYSAKGR